MILNCNVSKEDHELIVKIARHASALSDRLAASAGWQRAIYPVRDTLMDLTATHANGTPLDLDGLLHADERDFAHDVFGIRAHLNRETGRLEDCFVPRYAAR